MSNLLEDGAIELRRTLLEYAANSIVYSRGVQQVTLDAVLGSSLLRITKEDVTYLLKTELDVFMNPTDMGVMFPPQKGDRVTVLGYTYEVLHLPGENIYDHEDQFQELIRVHTKRVKV